MATLSHPICQVSWLENGKLVNDGKPAVIQAHLHYRQNAPRLDLAPVIYMCQEHYDQFSSRESFHYPQFQPRERITLEPGGLYSYFDDFQEALHITYSTLPIQVTVSPGSFTLPPEGTQQFTATVTGTSNMAVTWSAALGSINQTGMYTAPSITTGVIDTIMAVSAANKCANASVQVSIAAEISISIVVSPAGIAINFGQTQQFTAVVTGITNQNVTWSLAPGAVGIISPTGLYTAPAMLQTKSVDTVVATSVGDPDTTGQRSITINAGGVPVVLVNPPGVTLNPGQTQTFTASVTNLANQQVTWSIQAPALGTIDQTGLYTAPATATSPETDTVIATSVGYPAASNPASVSINATVLPVVLISPQGATVNPGATQQFTATVTGTSNTAVTWSLAPQSPGGTVLGTISSTGLFTAPASVAVQSFENVIATSVANTAANDVGSITLNAGGPAQLDLVRWIIMSTRTTQHLVGDANAPYSAQIIDTDPLYPANYPKNCVWQIKNKLGNPWDVHTYDNNFITHWITEDGDAVDQAACQAANGTSCWLYSHAYKRYLTPVHVMPRFFTSGASVTIDTPGPNTNYATTNCESSSPRVITIGDVRGITSGPFKISWGGSIDAGAGTGATAPNYDSVNGVNTIKVQYCYSGTIASGTFNDIEEYYFVLGFGQVGWYYYHGGVFQNKTVNNTLAASGCPKPNFPCGPGKSWFA